MSSDHAANLSGEWNGIFNYPRWYPPTEFQAVLTDSNGGLSGTISEIDVVRLSGGGGVTATVEGQRSGNAVRFTKYYDRATAALDTVIYTGTVSADGCEITGKWDIPRQWSGTFIMVRPAADEAEQERKVETEIEMSDHHPAQQ